MCAGRARRAGFGLILRRLDVVAMFNFFVFVLVVRTILLIDYNVLTCAIYFLGSLLFSVLYKNV